MKYYYKTPEQLSRELAPAPVRKFRFFGSKTSIIIFLDLTLILLITGILYYNGFFSRSQATSRSTEVHAGLEWSASLGETGAFYLHVRNPKSAAVSFPPEGLITARAEIKSRKETGSMELPLGPGEIDPFQTLDLSFPLNMAAGVTVEVVVYLVFQDRIVRLELPAVYLR